MEEAFSFESVEDAIRTAHGQEVGALDLVYLFAETPGPFDMVFRLKG